MPKDFSEDGAVGAGSTPSPGTPTGSGGLWSGGLPAEGADSNAGSAAAGGLPHQGGGGFVQSYAPQHSAGFTLPNSTTPGVGRWQQYLANNPSAPGGVADPRAMMFEDGGEVPDDTGEIAQSGEGGDISTLLSSALAAVKQGLDFGYQKYGLINNQTDQQMKDRAVTPEGEYDRYAQPKDWQGSRDAAYAGMRKSDNIEDRRGDPYPKDMTPDPQPYRTKADDLVDRVQDFRAGYNPMSQGAGINDIKSDPTKQDTPESTDMNAAFTPMKAYGLPDDQEDQ